VLFKQAKNDENQAQITALADTWQWSKRRYDDGYPMVMTPLKEIEGESGKLLIQKLLLQGLDDRPNGLGSWFRAPVLPSIHRLERHANTVCKVFL